MNRTFVKAAAGAAAVVGALAAMAAPAGAHVHTVNGKPIANGQHHPIFTSIGGGQGTSCETSPGPGGAAVGPAWYGLEVAHHGPDTGEAGKADGCYQTAVVRLSSGAWVPQHDTNPAID
jgi:hypothetical protein